MSPAAHEPLSEEACRTIMNGVVDYIWDKLSKYPEFHPDMSDADLHALIRRVCDEPK